MLMQNMTAQAERVGASVQYDEVTQITRESQIFRLTTSGKSCTAGAVIIATGATAKTLGLPGEAELMGRGVSTCATCDGFFYKGKDVAVVGGGDSAMKRHLIWRVFVAPFT